MELRGNAITHGVIHSSVIVPVFNEEEALSTVLKAIFRAITEDSFEVIVVDDGSSDGTRKVASSFPCRVVAHEVNRGKGAAMQTGIQVARGENVIFIDGDGTYPAEFIPEMASRLSRYDIVRCVRSDGRDNIPLVNRFGNAAFDRLLNVVHGVEGQDCLSGLFGVQRRHLVDMKLESLGFDIESEIAVKAKAMGLVSDEIPIQYHERLGTKKLSPIKDGVIILGRILSLALVFNPTITFVIPGLALWVIAVASLFLLNVTSLRTPLFVPSVNSFIVSTMAFLAGFQLVVLGYAAALYGAEAGLGTPNPRLFRIAQSIPYRTGVILSLCCSLAGFGWSLKLVVAWMIHGFGPFGPENTEALVMALALTVWGIQFICTLLFLSLSTNRARNRVAKEWFKEGAEGLVDEHPKFTADVKTRSSEEENACVEA